MRKISDIDSNVTFQKKESESFTKNIFNGSNVISYKSSTPTKSKNSSNLKKSEDIISKNIIGKIHKEIMDKNDINPSCPKSPQIGLNRNVFDYKEVLIKFYFYHNNLILFIFSSAKTFPQTTYF